MHVKRNIAGVLAGLALLAAQPSTAPARGERPGLFDYYVLSLSWSPSYCMRAERQRRKRGRDNAQCAPGRRLGFVLHGLWPQFRRGWPSQCRGAKRFVPDAVIREVLDVMPAKGLVIHEWRKHGTCSGLSPRAYFDLAEELFRRIRIPEPWRASVKPLKRNPEQIRAEFARANPGFTKDMFAPVCRGRGEKAIFTELRACFTPTGRPSRCGINERGLCRARLVTVPPVQ